MISPDHVEALSTARRLLRGFASAPDVRRQAQQFYSALVHAQGWSKAQQAVILDLGAWLNDYPALGQLKARCEETLGKLA